MSGYVLSDQDVFKIFTKLKSLLDSNKYPIMTSFVSEEVDFWIRNLKKEFSEVDIFIEMGCGSGRVIEQLEASGFTCEGFDNNKYLVEHCQNEGLKVLLLDAIQKVPQNLLHKYSGTGMAMNTLYNFHKPTRKKWINTANELLKENGILFFSVYADAQYTKEEIRQRVEYYKEAANPPKGYIMKYYDEERGRGIEMIDEKNNTEWFSGWFKKEDILKEISDWRDFRLEKFELTDCKIAYNIMLRKVH